MKTLIFNAELCTGCRACELACSMHCEGLFKPSHSRIRVVRFDADGLDVPLGCKHCEEPICATVCPAQAIRRDSVTGATIIDYDVCIGCKECVICCPFGAIRYDPVRKIIYKCDLCNGDPECVKWCFTRAIDFVEDINRQTEVRTRKQALKVAKSLAETRRVAPREV